eukprot:4602550-Pyramimonas_sp.AAC.1
MASHGRNGQLSSSLALFLVARKCLAENSILQWRSGLTRASCPCVRTTARKRFGRESNPPVVDSLTEGLTDDSRLSR